MKRIEEILENVKTVGIAGHVRPDGDCVGSCMGFYLYLLHNYPELEADIYLEEPGEVFSYISHIEDVQTSIQGKEDKVYDLFVTLDVSSRERIGVAEELFSKARRTVCIDHHISNYGFAQENHVQGEVSSASEVLYTLLDPKKLNKEMAEAIYTGMAHDTGVFQYTSTTPETMQIAGELMKFGFDFSGIVEHSFYEKTYVQNQVMGRVLAESILLLDGKIIVGCMRKKDMDFYGVVGRDMDGIVSQLRLTRGVEVAIFIHEMEPQCFKVSLRSNGNVDVSKVAVFFHGGGHVKASGCTMCGNMYDVINNLTEQIERQL